MSTISNLTPYGAAQVLNILLAGRGLAKRVTPQMLYGYAKKGALRDAVIEGSTPLTLDGDKVSEWIAAYIKRIETGTSGTRVDYDQLAAQFAEVVK